MCLILDDIYYLTRLEKSEWDDAIMIKTIKKIVNIQEVKHVIQF